jgi:Tfp pilus assembly protein PilF
MDAPAPDLQAAVAGVNAAAAAGDRNRAIDLAIAAMSRQLGDPVIWRWVAEGLEEDGRPWDALPLFNRAQAEAPEDIDLKLVFAAALCRHDAHREAFAPLEAVLATAPDHFDALMLIGAAALALRDLRRARAVFEQAAAAWPDRVEPLVELASLAAQQGAWDDARRFGARALAIAPGAARAMLALARADLAAREPAAAKARLDALLARADIDDGLRAESLSVAGDALDALDRPAEAFAAWRAREALLIATRAVALAKTPMDGSIALAKRLTTWFRATRAETWARASAPPIPVGPAVREHVFLLSFPRSGATLLEQILGSHPEAVALDEGLALAKAADHFLADPQSLRGLEGLGENAARGAREAYWRRVAEELAEDPAGKVFIDKNPLNSLRLPIIAKLFPDAKVLFALRDPRDVVLSCWRRLYYSQIVEFMTLEGSARFYDAAMELADLCRAKLPLAVHTLRHEALVADFEPQVREALAFIGLPWNPEVEDFARAPVLTVTPSAAQVGRGLNAEGVGQWRRYSVQMAPVAGLLEPWAARFGYPAAPSQPAPGATLSRVMADIGAAIEAGRLPEAMARAEAALEAGHVDALLHRLRGVRAQQDGRLELAIADFEAALRLGGEDAPVLNALGLALARAGRATDGLARLDRAIALAPGSGAYHHNRGWTLEAMGEMAGARDAYATAASLDPKNAQAMAALANLAARAGDWPAAREQAGRALAIDAGNPTAIVALARSRIADGDAAGAEADLRRLLASGRAGGHERAVAFEALGDALDQMARAHDAFEAYAAAAALLRTQYAPRFHKPGLERAPDYARRLTAAFAAQAPDAWRRAAAPTGASPGAGAAGHIFLLGFPRSGTTMLGQALACHPGVVTLDERQTLSDAAQAFLRPADGVSRLAEASAEDLEPYRQLYWRRVREAGAEPQGRVFVDKLPMNTLGLPLIAKLFPQAKILFLRRDPRDVVLSCFRRQFAPDATTVEFLDLGWTADLYDAVMALMATYRRVLDIDLREQGYEALAQDFDAEMRAICAFAGLAFIPSMADFAGRAGLVATPSSAQLSRGLNAEGVGAWRRYAAELAPVLPTLTPWVERFGYGA